MKSSEALDRLTYLINTHSGDSVVAIVLIIIFVIVFLISFAILEEENNMKVAGVAIVFVILSVLSVAGALIYDSEYHRHYDNYIRKKEDKYFPEMNKQDIIYYYKYVKK